jgi:acyl-CoA dehydrogenase
MTEPGAGSDVAAIQTTAVRDGDAWVLNGAKTFISNSMRADWIVVWATVDKSLGRGGHRAFVVERGTPGLEDMRYEHKMGLIAYESSSFTLRDCRVPALHLLGGEAHYAGRAGFKGAMKSFNATRPAIAVMAIGIARAAYDAAREFARTHYELDRPLPRYQRYREKLARMARKIEVGRMLCWRAAWMADHEQPNEIEASMAKAFCPAIAQEAASLAVEILGDAGVATEHHVEKLYRDVKAMDIVEGTGQIQRLVMARRLLGLPH